MAEVPADLRETFKALFITPFASHRWASAAGRSHWVELEGWQGSLAGPLSAIAESGGCEYVYSRDDWYFAAVNDPPSLRARLLEWHAGLTAGVARFAPSTPDETADLEFVRSLADQMRELVERSCALEQARWQTAGRVAPGAFLRARSFKSPISVMGCVTQCRTSPSDAPPPTPSAPPSAVPGLACTACPTSAP